VICVVESVGADLDPVCLWIPWTVCPHPTVVAFAKTQAHWRRYDVSARMSAARHAFQHGEQRRHQSGANNCIVSSSLITKNNLISDIITTVIFNFQVDWLLRV